MKLQDRTAKASDIVQVMMYENQCNTHQ